MNLVQQSLSYHHYKEQDAHTLSFPFRIKLVTSELGRRYITMGQLAFGKITPQKEGLMKL